MTVLFRHCVFNGGACHVNYKQNKKINYTILVTYTEGLSFVIENL